MIKDNLTGIILSALLHAGLLSWAYAVNNEPVKLSAPDNIVLTVSMFQEKVLTPAPIVKAVVKPVVKAVEEKISPPTPLNPEFADLPPVVKIETVKVKPPAPSPITIVEKKPKVKKEVIQEHPKLAMLEPVKPKVIKKTIVKKKPLIKKVIKKAKKKPVKKVIKRKIVKKTLKPKIVKKKVQRKIVKRAKPVRKPQKRVIAKAKQRPRAVSRAVKHIAKTQNSKKVGGVYYKNKHLSKKIAQPRTKTAPRYAKKATPAINPALNAKLSSQYKAQLQRIIAKMKRYPKRAKRRGQQGRVTVSFKVTHSGVISNIRIVKGSRHKTLNDATIKAIRLASRKLTFPKGMGKKSLTLNITLSYVLS